MDPMFPFKAENKQTFWQKVIALPPKIKIVIVFAIGIILASVAVFTWHIVYQSPSPSATVPGAQEQQLPSTPNTPAGETSQDPATEKEEAKKAENNPPANTPLQRTNSGGGSANTTPPPITPPATPPPSGSSRPSTSNTGPTGALTNTYSGGASNGSSGQTYQNTNFPAPGAPGYYIFSGNNLTFQNCHIHGDGILFSGDNITVENCIIEGGVSLSGTSGVTFRYNEVRDFSGDGIHLTSDSGQAANVTIAHNYIHNPTPSCGDHADGIQVRGVNTLTLYNNNFDMGPWVQICGQDALNAAIFFESANGGNSNLTVDSNFLNGAGITLRLNPGSNQKIINNRFGRDYKYSVVNNQTSAGNITQQSGNVMDDNGSPVNF